MGKIIAISGGEIGGRVNGRRVKAETVKIDKEIIKVSGKTRPRFLFVPTASSDAPGYVENVKNHFGRKLGCEIDVLYLISEQLSKKEIAKKIFSADIIYVGGGNTLKMMNYWRRFGVNKLLKQAYQKNIVLAGVSAGAICWFKYGNSDSRKFRNKKANFIKISGLGLIDALCCPHYRSGGIRQKSIKTMLEKTGIGIALDDCAAIQIENKNYRIILSKSGNGAYKFFWKKGVLTRQVIPVSKIFRPLKQLLTK